jgi:hypothetical protein
LGALVQWLLGVGSAIVSLFPGTIATVIALILFIGSMLIPIYDIWRLVIAPFFFGSVDLIAPIVLGLLIVPYIIFDVLENFIRGFSSQIGQEVSIIGWMGRLL